jgi:two-component system nitrate/nitrite response regulator NarL
MRILVVDDSILFREGLVNMFGTQPDFEVVGEVGTMHEAVTKARETRPDIILMDFSLPDGNGIDATQIIMSELPETKIVMLTIHEADERILAAIRSGAKGYLLKDLPFAKLVASVRGLMKNEAALSRQLTFRLLNEFANMRVRNDPATTELEDFSMREIEILRELAGDASNQEIAERLSLSIPTVKHYIHTTLKKLNMKNRKEAARFARHQGLGGFQVERERSNKA